MECLNFRISPSTWKRSSAGFRARELEKGPDHLAVSPADRDATDLRKSKAGKCWTCDASANESASAFEDELWLVIHLMIAGRLHWKAETGKSSGARSSSKFKAQLALFHFDAGTLSLTEAGTQRRASLHLVQGEVGLSSLDRGGVELFTSQKPDRKGGLGKFIDLARFYSYPSDPRITRSSELAN